MIMAGAVQRFGLNANGDWVCHQCGAAMDAGVVNHDHDGKNFTQRFTYEAATVASLQGDWVCAGCGAYMTERAADEAVVMEHRADCSAVAGMPLTAA